MSLEILSTQKSFGGWHQRVRHHAQTLDCDMVFAIYLPRDYQAFYAADAWAAWGLPLIAMAIFLKRTGAMAADPR